MNQDPREMDNCICSEWDARAGQHVATHAPNT